MSDILENICISTALAPEELPVFWLAFRSRSHRVSAILLSDGLTVKQTKAALAPLLPGGMAMPFIREKGGALPLEVIDETSLFLSLGSLGPLAEVLLPANHNCHTRRVVVAGGSVVYGDSTPAAERNILADADAAAHVFASSLPDITLCPVDAFRHQARAGFFPAGQWPEMMIPPNLEIDARQRLLCCLAAYGLAVRALPGRCFPAHIAVDTCGQYTKGKTVIDLNGLFLPGYPEELLPGRRPNSGHKICSHLTNADFEMIAHNR